jgi:hypothetical protein
MAFTLSVCVPTGTVPRLDILVLLLLVVRP